MHAFPAEIPPAEARRADVVDVRVARKVAPLFGVGEPIPPFHRTWVCDFTSLSLAELGRGAPNPDRAERSRLEAAPTPTDGVRPEWVWSGRAVWAPQQGTLPGALSNATLNRYGPDTKAAAVLAAANRLLHGSTAAVAAVCRHLAHTGCDAEVRLATWAGLVLEVYRAQPALVVAAVQARQVQRSLSARWGAQVDRAQVIGPDAPSEIHPPTPSTNGETGADDSAARWRPIHFDLVDSTLPALGLADDPITGVGLVTADALDDIASAWCHRLLNVGRPGRGVVWLTEDGDGNRRVHAMVRVGAVVAPFVAATLGGTPAADRRSAPALPKLPASSALAHAPLLQRRAHLLGALVATNYVRYRGELLLTWPTLRAQTRELIATAIDQCAEVLDVEDPVALQLRAYAAYLDVWDPLRTGDAGPPLHGGVAAGPDVDGDAGPLASPVRRLRASQQQVVKAWRSGRLDPGAAAYLLEIGAVALREATGDAATAGTCWPDILEARGLDPGPGLAARIDSVSDAQVFHLHHYAAWLARSGRRADLRRALAVQERVTVVRAEVTRREPAGYAAKSAAARAAHELAAEIATNLAVAIPERERGARVQALEAAARHAAAVLADPSIRRLLPAAKTRPATQRTAAVAARALAMAVRHGVAVEAHVAAAAVALLDAAIRTDAPGETQRGPHGEEAHLADGTPLTAVREWRAQMTAITDTTRSAPDG